MNFLLIPLAAIHWRYANQINWNYTSIYTNNNNKNNNNPKGCMHKKLLWNVVLFCCKIIHHNSTANRNINVIYVCSSVRLRSRVALSTVNTHTKSLPNHINEWVVYSSVPAIKAFRVHIIILWILNWYLSFQFIIHSFLHSNSNIIKLQTLCHQSGIP